MGVKDIGRQLRQQVQVRATVNLGHHVLCQWFAVFAQQSMEVGRTQTELEARTVVVGRDNTYEHDIVIATTYYQGGLQHRILPVAIHHGLTFDKALDRTGVIQYVTETLEERVSGDRIHLGFDTAIVLVIFDVGVTGNAQLVTKHRNLKGRWTAGSLEDVAEQSEFGFFQRGFNAWVWVLLLIRHCPFLEK